MWCNRVTLLHDEQARAYLNFDLVGTGIGIICLLLNAHFEYH